MKKLNLSEELQEEIAFLQVLSGDLPAVCRGLTESISVRVSELEGIIKQAPKVTKQRDALLQVCKNALADLEGIMPVHDPDGERTHSAWETIEELKKVIEGTGPTEEGQKTSMQKFISDIDFDLLKIQKLDLLKVAQSHEDATVRDNLDGIIHIIDKIQGIAVDEYGHESKKVFTFESDQPFSKGDTYWAVEEVNKILESVWDDVSEELNNPNVFKSLLLAKVHLFEAGQKEAIVQRFNNPSHISTESVVIRVTEKPEKYDNLNHIELRSDIENGLILNSFLDPTGKIASEPEAWCIEVLDVNEHHFTDFIYDSETEYEQDLKILGLL